MSFKFCNFERKLELECIKFRDFFPILHSEALIALTNVTT